MKMCSNSSVGYEYFKKNDELKQYGFFLLVYMFYIYIYEETQIGGITLDEQ